MLTCSPRSLSKKEKINHRHFFLVCLFHAISHSGCDRRGSNSGGESDEDNEEGDYTVYECPGLAPVIAILFTSH